jgi:LytS/YehU family sensor histidine kinase
MGDHRPGPALDAFKRRDRVAADGDPHGTAPRVLAQLPPELAQHPVPALLLQPLVENSIQHGLEPKVEGGRITVSAHNDHGQLMLEVADTGVGPGSARSGEGFGMNQVRERLAALHGAAAGIDFVAAPGGGSRTILRLPLQS